MGISPGVVVGRKNVADECGCSEASVGVDDGGESELRGRGGAELQQRVGGIHRGAAVDAGLRASSPHPQPPSNTQPGERRLVSQVPQEGTHY